MVRRVALEDPIRRFTRIAHILDRIQLHEASLESYASIFRIISQNSFDECYHLSAQSFVAEGLSDGFATMNININGTHYLLAALQELRPACQFYFAGTSEMFGKVSTVPQTENTPFHPRSPYGISKVAGFQLTTNYREAYGMFCVNGILFNHEGPRRGYEFVTRKITSTAARIKLGLATELRLGNLEARRDWGHAADYTRAMRLMMQHDQPDDYVIASGETHSVREFCERAFNILDLDYRDFVVSDESLFRPAEMDELVGDASKAHQVLGWQPSYSFQDLIEEMVQNDLEAAARTPEGKLLALSQKESR